MNQWGAERFSEGLLRETCGCWRWCGHGFFGASAEAEDRGGDGENNEIFHWMRWFLSKPRGRFLRENGGKEGWRKVFLSEGLKNVGRGIGLRLKGRSVGAVLGGRLMDRWEGERILGSVGMSA